MFIRAFPARRNHVSTKQVMSITTNRPKIVMTIAEACEMRKRFCLKQRQGTTQPDRNHDYYHQTQCQLNSTERAWYNFVVRRKKDFFIERIKFD